MKFAATTALILTLAGAAFAGQSGPKPTPAPAKAPAALVCPVTGEKIASVKDAAGSSVYKGKTYYFCCSGCKPAFDKNPAKYVKEAAKPAAKKPAAKATPAPAKA
jgi:Cu+-exporting ATPase